MTSLFACNTPARFWRVLHDVRPACWAEAVAEAAHLLPDAVRSGLAEGGDLAELVLGEGQFGGDHWKLGRARRLYYEVKPALPVRLTRRLRRMQASLPRRRSALGWPIEDRLVRFQAAVVAHVIRALGATAVPCLDFWPRGARSALVLTHDVETASGQRFVATVADLEERMGFRSSFNLVAGLYPVDRGLVRDLEQRGFEVGVHGYRHDGKMFRSHAEFSRRAALVNTALAELGAVGYRSPLTHRNPEWMQELAVDYDLSFFDTDPYEPIPGGTMSVWPFRIGAFVELPYTLVQDYTLRYVLGERTPRLWLEKLEFIRRSRGMALLNTHPDYLRDPSTLGIYRAFLSEVAGTARVWHSLPRDVAAWWRARAEAPDAESLPGATAGLVAAEDPFDLTAPVTADLPEPGCPGRVRACPFPPPGPAPTLASCPPCATTVPRSGVTPPTPSCQEPPAGRPGSASSTSRWRLR